MQNTHVKSFDIFPYVKDKYDNDKEIYSKLKVTVEDSEVYKKSSNQDLLKKHIESVKKQLAEIHNANPYFGKRSIYSTTAAVTGNFVAEA